MRYRMNLVEHAELCLDEEGVELPNLSAARDYAIMAAREIIASDIRDGVLALDVAIQITDGTGQALMLVQFDDAVRAAA